MPDSFGMQLARQAGWKPPDGQPDDLAQPPEDRWWEQTPAQKAQYRAEQQAQVHQYSQMLEGRRQVAGIMAEEAAKANQPQFSGGGSTDPRTGRPLFETEDLPRFRQRVQQVAPGLSDEEMQGLTDQYTQEAKMAYQGREFQKHLEAARQGAFSSAGTTNPGALAGPTATGQLSDEQLYGLERLPFISRYAGHVQEQAVNAANARSERGEATQEDLQMLARVQHQHEVEQGKGWARKAVDVASTLPAVLTEYATAGKLAGPAGAIVQRLLGGAAGGLTARAVAGRVAGAVTEGAVRTAVRPDILYEQSQEQGLGKAALSQGIENTLWSLVGGPTGAKGLSGLAGRAATPILTGEANAEIQGALGTGQGGLWTRLINAKSDEERNGILKDWSAQAAVMGGLGAGHAAIDAVRERSKGMARRAQLDQHFESDPVRNAAWQMQELPTGEGALQQALGQTPSRGTRQGVSRPAVEVPWGNIGLPGEHDHLVDQWAQQNPEKAAKVAKVLSAVPAAEAEAAAKRVEAQVKQAEAQSDVQSGNQPPPAPGGAGGGESAPVRHPGQPAVPGPQAPAGPASAPAATVGNGSRGVAVSPSVPRAAGGVVEPSWGSYQTLPVRPGIPAAAESPPAAEEPPEPQAAPQRGTPEPTPPPEPLEAPKTAQQPEAAQGPAESEIAPGQATAPGAKAEETAKLPVAEALRRIDAGEDMPGLTPRQRHVVAERGKGRTLEDIGNDPEFLEGKEPGKDRREAVRKEYEEALQRLHGQVEEPPTMPPQDASKEEVGEEAQHLNLKKEKGLPETGDLTKRKSANASDVYEDPYDRAMEHLNEQARREAEASGGNLPADRIQFFNDEARALGDEQMRGATKGPALRRAVARRKAEKAAAAQAASAPTQQGGQKVIGGDWLGEAPTPGEAGAYHHIPGQGSQAKAASGLGGQGPGAFDLIATQNHLLNGVNYVVKRVPGDRKAVAAALTDQQAIVTSKLHAGDPTINLEEHAHNLAKHLGLETDPTKLPPDVRDGFKQFSHPALPPNLVNDRVMMEGFAQWVVRRALGQGNVGTPAMQAAAKYGEKFLADNGLADPMNRLQSLYAKHQAMTAAQQYGKTIGNEAAQPVGQTKGERASGFLRNLADSGRRRIDNDLHDLGRMEDHSAAMGNAVPAQGQGPMETAQALRRSGQTYEADWLQNGIPYISGSGEMVPGSKGYDEATARVNPGESEMFNAYAKARNEVTEYQIEDAQIQAGNKVPRTVTKEQHDTAQAVLRELRIKNPDQFQRFADTHQNLIDASNQGLKLLGQLGVIDQQRALDLIAAHPDYTPRERVFDEMTGAEYPSTGMGGGTPGFLKSRGLEGEMTRPALDTFKERYGKVARLAAKQLMDAPIRDMLRGEGMGKFAREMKESRPDPNDPSKTLTAEPDDETKHIWKTRENGKTVRFMVADNPLWDHLRGEPVQKSASVRLAEGLAKVPILNMVPKLIRLGATAASPYWHLRDMLPTREPLQFFENSVNPKSLPTVGAWYRHYPSYLATGHVPADSAAEPYVTLYNRLAGDTGLYLNQGFDPPTAPGRASQFLQTVIHRLSYPEIVPRAVELKNVLDARGIDADAVRQWNRDGSMPPVDVQVQLKNAAGEVTHNYMRQGQDTRAWSKIVPFLGAHVANTSKWIRNWQINPARMAGAVSLLVAATALKALWKKNDQEYQEQPIESRGKTEVGPLAFAGPRGPDAVIAGLTDEAMRWATGANPHAGRIGYDVAEQAIPGGPQPYSTGVNLLLNRQRLIGPDIPIVPHGEDQSFFSRGTLTHRLPYLEQQVTGGFGGNVVRAAAERDINKGLNPFYRSPNHHQSVNDLYDALQETETAEHARKQAELRGENPGPANPDHYRYQVAARRLASLNKELQKSPERKDEIMAEKINVAREALRRPILKSSKGVNVP